MMMMRMMRMVLMITMMIMVKGIKVMVMMVLGEEKAKRNKARTLLERELYFLYSCPIDSISARLHCVQ